MRTITPRQHQILTAWADDYTTAQIAAQLHIAPETVNTHAQSIYRRLAVHTRAGAVAKAIRIGLIPGAYFLYPETA